LFLTSSDDFRIFAGNLGNEVNDDALKRAFHHYKSAVRARVIRDKRTGKSKGFGFVSFMDANDFVRALREMNGM
jgi:RNA recognition motif-containing protein